MFNRTRHGSANSFPPWNPIVFSRFPSLLPRLLLLLLGTAAYATGLFADFTFDGVAFIEKNDLLNQLWPPAYLWNYTRPLSFLTFAINKSVFGPEPFSFAVVNVAIHLLAAQCLYTLVLVTLRQSPRIPPSLAERAQWLALAASLLWVVHPLNSQGVAYLIQRQEALAGLFYIGTLAAFAQGALGGNRVWFVIAWISCAMGMLSKEMMVTAPLCVLWLDLAVLSRSPRETLRRWPWHLALWSTWGLLAWVMSLHAGEYVEAGVGTVVGVSRWQYFRSQPFSLASYLMLWVWPQGQCADALRLPVNNPNLYVPALIAAGTVLTTILVLSIRRPPLGFLLGAGLLVLTPTSSIVPIQDLYFEHRMYVPSMALAILSALLINRLASRWPARSTWLRGGILATLLTALIITTNLRSAVYLSDEAFWRDVVAKSKVNSRAYTNLSLLIVAHARDTTNESMRQQFLEEAIATARRSISIHSLNPHAYRNLAFVLGEAGRREEGEKYVQMARLLDAKLSQEALLDFGNANRQAEPELALFCYERARELPPESSEVYNNLGILTQEVEKNFVKAEVCFQRALAISPGNANVYNSYGTLLGKLKRYPEALQAFNEALRLDPTLESARRNRQVILRLMQQTAAPPSR
ncbi:MAG: hypothetical protein C0478_14340 [Planctomyces sp.]|nr:hypothetical protein [Planctomyces sp.]